MNPEPAHEHYDHDPTILMPEEEENDLREIRQARAEIEQHGTILLQDLREELRL